MSITNYSDLQQLVEDFIGKDNLTPMLPAFISLAESRIASDLMTNELHKTEPLTIDTAIQLLPDNFKGMVRINIDGSPTLSYLPPDNFFSTYGASTTGQPIAFTVEGNSIHFSPSPDISYSGYITYIAKPDLAADGTNRLLSISPDVYLFAALCEASDYIQDTEAFAKYELKYRNAIDSLNEADDFKGALSIKLDGVV